METRVGELFDGRYRLERRLGHGGMADVFLAWDETLGRSVAIKVLADRYARDAGFVERFRREASAAAGLNHPNIVSVYDRGQSNGQWYIAMEYLEGQTLKDEIVERAPLPEAETARIAMQVCSALAFAHRRGVVHRDIKPQNVMVLPDGRVKVTDFGIARAQNTSQMTEVGSIVGTAQYLSPEQARGMNVGPQSDLYSLGIVLFEMLTGQVPFSGGSAVEIAMRHVSERPPPVRRLNRRVSAGMEQIVERALAKDPEQRFASADQMGRELERVLHGEPTTRDTQQATRIIAATPPTMVTERYQPTSVMAPEPPPPRGRRRSVWPWLLALLLLAVAGAVGFIVYDQLQTPTAAVADVRGDTVGQAQQRLEPFFVTETIKERNDKVALNHVIRTDPAAGTTAEEGSTVRLFVSAGPHTSIIPKLRGMNVNDATQKLQELHLVAQIQQVDTSALAAGLVAGSDPRAGEVARWGDTVTLRVSSGNVAVPQLAGDTVAEAQKELEDAKLRLGATTRANSETVPKDQVISSNPSAGTAVQQGTSVAIVVSDGPELIPVPDVRGQDVDTATATLETAGFTVRIIDVKTTDPALDGIVGGEPQHGQQKPRGTKIVLYVNKFTQPPPPGTTGP
jgi:eukaryotic-like serine/threonine-protein kinase